MRSTYTKLLCVYMLVLYADVARKLIFTENKHFWIFKAKIIHVGPILDQISNIKEKSAVFL